MATDEAKKAYQPRKELIEPTFGIIKEQMGIRRFLLRGLNNARAEGCLVATAFNLHTLYGAWKVWGAEKRRKLFNLLKELGENSFQTTLNIVTFDKNTPGGVLLFSVC
jgi:hypothetical protein